MPMRETDSNFESELFEEARAGFEAKFGVSQYWLPLPLLLVDIEAEKDLPCHESAEETIAISAHVSARIHAWYEQLATAYDKVEDPPAHVGIELEIELQKFDPGAPDCDHRLYHSRRLQLQRPEMLPDLSFYFVGPGGEDSEQGGYKISDTEHYPRETDTDEDEDLHNELNDNLGEAYGDGYDLNMFRVKPFRERIEPLLAAFAKSLALDNMPSLEDGEMFTHLWWAPSDDMEAKGYDLPTGKGHRRGVKFIAGRGSLMQESNRAAAAAAPTPPVVQWQVGDWRPSQEVMGLFENLGRQEWLNIEWN
ncbi:hypothetical protein N0V87_007370, partial [Didymella glomerata]